MTLKNVECVVEINKNVKYVTIMKIKVHDISIYYNHYHNYNKLPIFSILKISSKIIIILYFIIINILIYLLINL